MSDQKKNDEVEVHEGRRTGTIVSVRLKPDEADLLEALAERQGRTLSETMRVALQVLASTPDRRELELPTATSGSFTRGSGTDTESLVMT